MNQTLADIQALVEEPYPATAEGQDCSSNTTITRAFLDILRAAKPDQQLVFQLDEAPLVAAGYHVTEVKAVTYNTMDCGGVADKWEETIIQLWNPGDEPEREYMTVRKFLAIYDRVAKHIPGRSCQVNHIRNRMAASLGGGRSLDRSFCCRPGFTASWP